MGRPYRSFILVALLCIVAYANALPGGFVYDDFDLIVNNAWLSEGSLLEAFRQGYWETSRGGSFYYRPMISLSYKLDHAVWGKDPFGYHLRNLGLHLVTSLMVLVLATRWLSSWGAGLAAAAIFAVHPVHTQSVTWIAGRTDLLAAFFFLAATSIGSGMISNGSSSAMYASASDPLTTIPAINVAAAPKKHGDANNNSG